MAKHAIFVVGPRGSGKSTIIRALTGCGRTGSIWNVRSLTSVSRKAFVLHSSLQEMGAIEYPPEKFLQKLEEKYGVRRGDYDMLICALELKVRNQAQYRYEQYIMQTQGLGLDVKIAAIGTKWDGTPSNAGQIRSIQQFANTRGIDWIIIDASRDPNQESAEIRARLYPR